MNDQGVLHVLGKLGTSYCTLMSEDIFTQNTRQTITSSRNDAEALGYIRDVSRQLFYSFIKVTSFMYQLLLITTTFQVKSDLISKYYYSSELWHSMISHNFRLPKIYFCI